MSSSILYGIIFPPEEGVTLYLDDLREDDSLRVGCRALVETRVLVTRAQDHQVPYTTVIIISPIMNI
jgi:hypothetical protein